MNVYPWDLEERAIDAVVAYLRTELGEVATIKAALDFVDAITFPLVSIFVEDSDNANDTAQFNGLRKLLIGIEIVTEAITEYGTASENAAMFRTARETHRAVKSQVVGALARQHLETAINAVGSEGIWFSSAHMTRQNPGIENNTIFTMQMLECICSPKEVGL